jgi:hypothetical protein
MFYYIKRISETNKNDQGFIKTWQTGKVPCNMVWATLVHVLLLVDIKLISGCYLLPQYEVNSSIYYIHAAKIRFSTESEPCIWFTKYPPILLPQKAKKNKKKRN